MQKSWIAVGAMGVIGVVLAFLLLPSPDTGADVPPPRPAASGRPEASGPDRLVPPRPGERSRPSTAVDGRPNAVQGAHPGAVRALQRRNGPDALAAGRAAAPWGLIRRQLLDTQDPVGKAVLDESATLIAKLREMRRDPDSHDFAALEAEQRALAEKIRQSTLDDDPMVSGALDRLDSILGDYQAEISKPQ